MSQDHKTVLLMALLRRIDPVQSPLNQVRFSVAWEPAHGGWVGVQQQHLWVEISKVISHLPLGQGLFIVLPSVPEIENVPVSGECTLVSPQCGEPFSIFFFVLFPTFLPTLTFILIIVFIPDSILVDFLYHSPLQYLINFDFCVTAIHQRLESDGTERVEGSMTQRLENILNSKNLLIQSPTI